MASNSGVIKRSFALAIPFELATTENFVDMELNGGVAGVVIIGRNLTASSVLEFSPDSKSPNQHASLYQDEDVWEWNPRGTNLRHTSLNFPVTVLTESEQSTNEILEVYFLPINYSRL